VGFKTADRIAQALGLPSDHPSRIEAGVVFVLNQASDDGHVFLPRQELTEKAIGLLEVAPELVQPAVERLAQEQSVREELIPLDKLLASREPGEDAPPARQKAPSGAMLQEGCSSAPVSATPPSVGESSGIYGTAAVYLAPLYYGEVAVAERLHLLGGAIPSRLSDLPPAFTPLDPALSAEQQKAIRTALSNPVSILTGGPGTGKTTALKALIEALEAAGKSYALASPTGRAAKRLSQACGKPAATIHRLLGYSPGEGFKHNHENPLPVDMLVVDEASMLDLYLANHLLKALQPGTHLLLVGDVDQLPSVGAGDVLRDVIQSEAAAVTRLTTIFRQAAHSQIITNAHRINRGQMPLFPARDEVERSDFFFFPAETPEEAANWVEELVTRRIPSRFGLHPRADIQVLAPMYRGPAGVTALNQRLQASLNPQEGAKPEKALFGQTFRPGDKLMQTQNNYDKEVFNGDIGALFAIDPIEHSLTVDFEGRAVTYDWSEADQLVLAYAVSVHKAQGSEFPAVVIPLVTGHYLMLQRNLLYTAVTRARRLCVLVGSKRAIAIAVRNDKVARRYTGLGWRLREG
jgi:exodeoxyribonuclease V alpha subunit